MAKYFCAVYLSTLHNLMLTISAVNYSSDTERSKALMPTLARVLASTFLTIIAAYKLYVPHFDGKFPGTTTEPAGTRP